MSPFLVGILVMVQSYPEVCKEKEFNSLLKEVRETIKTKRAEYEQLENQKDKLRKEGMSYFLYSQHK